jgi:tRNA(fMet)-specific endonuclease VapC
LKLLDTNVCIEIMNGRPPIVQARFESALAAGERLFVSSITNFELWYGAEWSGRPEFNRSRLQHFFSGLVEELAFGKEDAKRAGEVRAVLEKRGTPIGGFDTLTAGQALARGLVMVTHNVGEFGRVEGLRVEDWQAEMS